MLSAPVGGHAMNLAALSAALVTLVSAAPPGLLEAAAGLALIGTLAAGLPVGWILKDRGTPE